MAHAWNVHDDDTRPVRVAAPGVTRTAAALIRSGVARARTWRRGWGMEASNVRVVVAGFIRASTRDHGQAATGMRCGMATLRKSHSHGNAAGCALWWLRPRVLWWSVVHETVLVFMRLNVRDRPAPTSGAGDHARSQTPCVACTACPYPLHASVTGMAESNPCSSRVSRSTSCWAFSSCLAVRCWADMACSARRLCAQSGHAAPRSASTTQSIKRVSQRTEMSRAAQASCLRVRGGRTSRSRRSRRGRNCTKSTESQRKAFPRC